MPKMPTKGLIIICVNVFPISKLRNSILFLSDERLNIINNEITVIINDCQILKLQKKPTAQSCSHKLSNASNSHNCIT